MIRTLRLLTLVPVLLLGLSTIARADCNLDPQEVCNRPILMGVSASATPSNNFIFAGTAGMMVHAFHNPAVKFILTNSHVGNADPNNLCPNGGTPFTTQLIQPGSLDLGFDPGLNSQYFAGLLAYSPAISFAPLANNLIDTALIYTTTSFAQPTIRGIGMPTNGWSYPFVSQPVTKSGRTSGVTVDQVNSIHAVVNVNYGASCGVARFVDQALTGGTFGIPGDSGSAVLDGNTHVPVGLYFAGSSTIGVFNPIYWVYVLTGVFVEGQDVPQLEQQGTGPVSAAMVNRARQIMSSNEARLMTSPEVVGIGIGESATAGQPAIVVYLKSATASARAALPASVGGIDVRVVESGEIVAH